MITDFFMGLGFTMSTWFLDLLTWAGVDLPTDPAGPLVGFVSQFAAMGVWVPWSALAIAATASIGVWLVCIGVKALRALVAHVPAVGGAG